MSQRFTLFKRGDIFYCEDTLKRTQKSLRTRDRDEAVILLHTKNEALRQPFLNLRIAQPYLAASDPGMAKAHVGPGDGRVPKNQILGEPCSL